MSLSIFLHLLQRPGNSYAQGLFFHIHVQIVFTVGDDETAAGEVDERRMPRWKAAEETDIRC